MDPDFGHQHLRAGRRRVVPRPARLTRRDALRLAATAGVTAAVVPRLSAAERVARHALADLSPIATRRLDWPVPRIVTRAMWGADEQIRESGQEYDSAVEKLIVHHTVTPTSPSDPAAVLRGLYQYAVSREYIDVPYHWLIDQHGNIYEGRWARDFPDGAPHTGESSTGANVRGGHALNHNARSIGIAFMGTYTSTLPPPAAVEALVTLLAWKCARWGIDPLGATPYVDASGETHTHANICGHRDTKATACPGEPMWSQLPAIRERVASRLRDGDAGYWIAASDGRTIAFGDLPDQGDTRRLGLPSRIAGISAHPSGRGYWLFGADGGVFTFGAARYHGSTGSLRLTRPVVGMAPTPSGNGYWLVGSDGGVFTFGDARFAGSTGALRLNQTVLGLCPTPSGAGYWLFARDGGIFSFGDARFFGSTGGIRLNRPIVAMAVTPTGKGYWLAAEDGGVFTFGDARYFGSGAARTVSVPVVAMAASSTGAGYALLLRDGGVLTFGDAPFFGSAAGRVSDAVGFAGKLVSQ